MQVPGVKLVAVADCYDGRLAHAKELWGNDLFTTRDYREILARKDIDAVLIATPDHWHKQAAVDAMHAGKDVYCEKPMIHLYADGPEMIEASRSTNRILQVGSQRVSSIDLRQGQGAARLRRHRQAQHGHRPLGPQLLHGRLELHRPARRLAPRPATGRASSAPRRKIPFNAEQFFQWRKWKAYGSGVAGDLFVHLFSGTHFITGSNGPTRAMATGGLRFWKDGRDVPDVMLGLFDYREGFNLSLRVNFVDGGEESEGLIFTGSEGTMEIAGNSVSVSRVPRQKAPGYTIGTFTNAMQQQILEAIPPEVSRHASHRSAARRRSRSTSPRPATATATITSTTSSTPSAAASPSSKTPSSASAPPVPRCSATSASSAATSSTGTPTP